MCQQCPIVCVGQMYWSLHERIREHESDIRNHSIQKPLEEDFNHPVFTVSVYQKKFKGNTQLESIE